MCLLVDLEDVVHPLERHDDAAVRWDARARQSRATAARGDRYPVLGACPEHFGHLRGGLGHDDGEGSHRLCPERLVMRLVVDDIDVRTDSAVSDACNEKIDERVRLVDEHGGQHRAPTVSAFEVAL